MQLVAIPEAAGNAVGKQLSTLCQCLVFKRIHRLTEKPEPAPEEFAGDIRQCNVLGHRRATVGAGAQQHGRPELHHFFQMGIPIVNMVIENRAQLLIFAHAIIKKINKLADFVCGSQAFPFRHDAHLYKDIYILNLINYSMCLSIGF